VIRENDPFFKGWLRGSQELLSVVSRGERWAVEAPKELAIHLGLAGDASIESIAAEVSRRAAQGVGEEGRIHVGLPREPGDKAQVGVLGGGRVEPRLELTLSAVQKCIQVVADNKMHLQWQLADRLSELQTMGADLKLRRAAGVSPALAAVFDQRVEDLTALEQRLPATIGWLTKIEASLAQALTAPPKAAE